MAGAYLKARAPCELLGATPVQGIVAADGMEEGRLGEASKRGFGALSRRAGCGKKDHPGGREKHAYFESLSSGNLRKL